MYFLTTIYIFDSSGYKLLNYIYYFDLRNGSGSHAISGAQIYHELNQLLAACYLAFTPCLFY